MNTAASILKDRANNKLSKLSEPPALLKKGTPASVATKERFGHFPGQTEAFTLTTVDKEINEHLLTPDFLPSLVNVFCGCIAQLERDVLKGEVPPLGPHEVNTYLIPPLAAITEASIQGYNYIVSNNNNNSNKEQLEKQQQELLCALWIQVMPKLNALLIGCLLGGGNNEDDDDEDQNNNSPSNNNNDLKPHPSIRRSLSRACLLINSMDLAVKTLNDKRDASSLVDRNKNSNNNSKNNNNQKQLVALVSAAIDWEALTGTITTSSGSNNIITKTNSNLDNVTTAAAQHQQQRNRGESGSNLKGTFSAVPASTVPHSKASAEALTSLKDVISPMNPMHTPTCLLPFIKVVQCIFFDNHVFPKLYCKKSSTTSSSSSSAPPNTSSSSPTLIMKLPPPNIHSAIVLSFLRPLFVQWGATSTATSSSSENNNCPNSPVSVSSSSVNNNSNSSSTSSSPCPSSLWCSPSAVARVLCASALIQPSAESPRVTTPNTSCAGIRTLLKVPEFCKSVQEALSWLVSSLSENNNENCKALTYGLETEIPNYTSSGGGAGGNNSSPMFQENSDSNSHSSMINNSQATSGTNNNMTTSNSMMGNNNNTGAENSVHFLGGGAASLSNANQASSSSSIQISLEMSLYIRHCQSWSDLFLEIVDGTRTFIIITNNNNTSDDDEALAVTAATLKRKLVWILGYIAIQCAKIIMARSSSSNKQFVVCLACPCFVGVCEKFVAAVFALCPPHQQLLKMQQQQQQQRKENNNNSKMMMAAPSSSSTINFTNVVSSILSEVHSIFFKSSSPFISNSNQQLQSPPTSSPATATTPQSPNINLPSFTSSPPGSPTLYSSSTQNTKQSNNSSYSNPIFLSVATALDELLASIVTASCVLTYTSPEQVSLEVLSNSTKSAQQQLSASLGLSWPLIMIAEDTRLYLGQPINLLQLLVANTKQNQHLVFTAMIEWVDEASLDEQSSKILLRAVCEGCLSVLLGPQRRRVNPISLANTVWPCLVRTATVLKSRRVSFLGAEAISALLNHTVSVFGGSHDENIKGHLVNALLQYLETNCSSLILTNGASSITASSSLSSSNSIKNNTNPTSSSLSLSSLTQQQLTLLRIMNRLFSGADGFPNIAEQPRWTSSPSLLANSKNSSSSISKLIRILCNEAAPSLLGTLLPSTDLRNAGTKEFASPEFRNMSSAIIALCWQWHFLPSSSSSMMYTTISENIKKISADRPIDSRSAADWQLICSYLTTVVLDHAQFIENEDAIRCCGSAIDQLCRIAAFNESVMLSNHLVGAFRVIMDEYARLNRIEVVTINKKKQKQEKNNINNTNKNGDSNNSPKQQKFQMRRDSLLGEIQVAVNNDDKNNTNNTTKSKTIVFPSPAKMMFLNIMRFIVGVCSAMVVRNLPLYNPSLSNAPLSSTNMTSADNSNHHAHHAPSSQAATQLRPEVVASRVYFALSILLYSVNYRCGATSSASQFAPPNEKENGDENDSSSSDDDDTSSNNADESAITNSIVVSSFTTILEITRYCRRESIQGKYMLHRVGAVDLLAHAPTNIALPNCILSPMSPPWHTNAEEETDDEEEQDPKEAAMNNNNNNIDVSETAATRFEKRIRSFAKLICKLCLTSLAIPNALKPIASDGNNNHDYHNSIALWDKQNSRSIGLRLLESETDATKTALLRYVTVEDIGSFEWNVSPYFAEKHVNKYSDDTSSSNVENQKKLPAAFSSVKVALKSVNDTNSIKINDLFAELENEMLTVRGDEELEQNVLTASNSQQHQEQDLGSSVVSTSSSSVSFNNNNLSENGNNSPKPAITTPPALQERSSHQQQLHQDPAVTTSTTTISSSSAIIIDKHFNSDYQAEVENEARKEKLPVDNNIISPESFASILLDSLGCLSPSEQQRRIAPWRTVPLKVLPNGLEQKDDSYYQQLRETIATHRNKYHINIVVSPFASSSSSSPSASSSSASIDSERKIAFGNILLKELVDHPKMGGASSNEYKKFNNDNNNDSSENINTSIEQHHGLRRTATEEYHCHLYYNNNNNKSSSTPQNNSPSSEEQQQEMIINDNNNALRFSFTNYFTSVTNASSDSSNSSNNAPASPFTLNDSTINQNSSTAAVVVCIVGSIKEMYQCASYYDGLISKMNSNTGSTNKNTATSNKTTYPMVLFLVPTASQDYQQYFTPNDNNDASFSSSSAIIAKKKKPKANPLDTSEDEEDDDQREQSRDNNASVLNPSLLSATTFVIHVKKSSPPTPSSPQVLFPFIDGAPLRGLSRVAAMLRGCALLPAHSTIDSYRNRRRKLNNATASALQRMRTMMSVMKVMSGATNSGSFAGSGGAKARGQSMMANSSIVEMTPLIAAATQLKVKTKMMASSGGGRGGKASVEQKNPFLSSVASPPAAATTKSTTADADDVTLLKNRQESEDSFSDIIKKKQEQEQQQAKEEEELKPRKSFLDDDDDDDDLASVIAKKKQKEEEAKQKEKEDLKMSI